MEEQDTSAVRNERLPNEILLAIFYNLDGPTLAACATTCRRWQALIGDYDSIVWQACATRDFACHARRRFWKLHFPEPELHNAIDPHSLRRSWQDMYRITRNWFTGNCSGYYPPVKDDVSSTSFPYAIVGSPQEHTFTTTLTIASTGEIVRSNPTYRRRQNGPQSIKIQCPRTLAYIQYLDQDVPVPPQPQPNVWVDQIVMTGSVCCHYTHPSSKWLVTGSLDGAVVLWDIPRRCLARVWSGHRGRVLCVGMNQEVAVSGGSDSMLRVWDLNDHDYDQPHSPPQQSWLNRRGAIDISAYLSARSSWYQGVGELVVNEHLVACAPDASGPILVFSLLTGSLVYELGHPLNHPAWSTSSEAMIGITKLCLTPYFLLTKGKLLPNDDLSKVYPLSRPTPKRKHHKQPSYGYVTQLSASASASTTPALTPYQLLQQMQANQPATQQQDGMTPAWMNVGDIEPVLPLEPTPRERERVCINVWNLQTGKIDYRLAPTVDPEMDYTITDIRTTPDGSKVLACVELRSRMSREERLFCWDFACKERQKAEQSPGGSEVTAVLVDGNPACHPDNRTVGHSWACFM